MEHVNTKIDNYINRFLFPIKHQSDYIINSKKKLTSKSPIVPKKIISISRDLEREEQGIKYITNKRNDDIERKDKCIKNNYPIYVKRDTEEDNGIKYIQKNKVISIFRDLEREEQGIKYIKNKRDTIENNIFDLKYK
jgi:hypothetical protein